MAENLLKTHFGGAWVVWRVKPLTLAWVMISGSVSSSTASGLWLTVGSLLQIFYPPSLSAPPSLKK